MDKTTKQQQAEAMLAIHATQGEQAPRGELPSHEELALLLDGRLSFKRRKEVMSHINANTELFAHWVSLVEAKNVFNSATESEQNLLQRLRLWLTPPRLGFIGTALVVVTTIAIVIPLLDDSVTISPQQPRSTPDYASSGNAQIETAVQAGIILSYQGYSVEEKQALPIRRRLSEKVVPEQSTLSTINPLAIQLGEALLGVYRDCQQKNDKLMGLQQDKIKQLTTALKLPDWTETSDTTAYCKQVDAAVNLWIE